MLDFVDDGVRKASSASYMAKKLGDFFYAIGTPVREQKHSIFGSANDVSSSGAKAPILLRPQRRAEARLFPHLR